MLFHRISTEDGQSGSPLISIEKNNTMNEPDLHIVAIHKGGYTSLKENVDSNVARLLTP